MMLWPLIAISPTACSGSSPKSISSQLSGWSSVISTPGIGTPIEPTRTSSPYGEKLATGEVSERP